MPKIANELGALVVSRLSDPGMHCAGGVQGMALHITKTGARSWLLRVMVGGKRREMGLGNFPGVTLAQAAWGAGAGVPDPDGSEVQPGSWCALA